METDSMYMYRGSKFEDYINLKMFSEELENELAFTSKNPLFGDVYKDVIKVHPKKNVDKLLFNHVFYGQLKHVYLKKGIFSEGIPLSTYEYNINLLLETFKTESIDVGNQDLIKNKGFSLLDSLNITKSNVYFIAGLDREVTDNKVTRIRMLIGKSYSKFIEGKKKIKYLLAGIEVDYNQSLCMFLINNGSDVPQEDEDEDRVSTPTSFYNYIQSNIMPYLNFKEVIDADKDKKAMFDYCKELLDTMFSDDINEIQYNFQKDIEEFTENSKEKLNRMGNKITKKQEKDLSQTIESLLLGIYVKNNLLDTEEFKMEVRKSGLPGYPTKINYKNNSRNNSSTGSSSVKKPLYESETLYSLYTDFGNSYRLSEWSMAWFTENEGLDVIRTNIKSTKRYFKVLFAPTRQLDERIIYNVIRTLNEKRMF